MSARWKTAILAGVVGLVAGALVVGGGYFMMNRADEDPTRTSEASEPETEESDLPVEFDADDFSIEMIIKTRSCDDYGCVMTLDSELTINSGPPSGDNVWDITFDVVGGEDGPITETITLGSDGYTGGQGVVLTTPDRKTKVKARIKSVVQAY